MRKAGVISIALLGWMEMAAPDGGHHREEQQEQQLGVKGDGIGCLDGRPR